MTKIEAELPYMSEGGRETAIAPVLVDSPRIEKKSTPTHLIEYDGFTDEQKQWVEELVNSTGLPLNNVDGVDYRPNKRGEEGTLGSYHFIDTRITLYKSLEKGAFPDAESSEQVQASIVVHETAHSFDPFTGGEFGKKTLQIYGSEKEKSEAAKRVERIVDQTDKTRIFLNGYHRYNYQMLVEARIQNNIKPSIENEQNLRLAELIFKRETHAILTQLRFTNPKHLKEVSDAQQAKMWRRGNPPVDLTEEIDRTLMTVMRIGSREKLNSHIEEFRSKIAQSKTPLAPDLAA